MKCSPLLKTTPKNRLVVSISVTVYEFSSLFLVESKLVTLVSLKMESKEDHLLNRNHSSMTSIRTGIPI